MDNNNSEFSKSITKIHITILSCLLVFFIILFVMSYQLGGTAGKVPLMVAGVAIILSVIELLSLIKAVKSQISEGQPIEPVVVLKWHFSMIIVITYIAVLMLFGFIASTLIYLFIWPALLGYRKWRVNAIFSIVSTVILYLSFVKLFMVHLPEGIIIVNLLGR